MSIKEVGVAIIGCGSAQVQQGSGHVQRRHMPALQQAGARIVAGVDLDPRRREEFRDRWGIEVFATQEELNEAGIEYELTLVGVPDRFHHRETVKALEAGKHVLCEKPLALSADEARAIMRLALSKGLWVRQATQREYMTEPIARLVAGGVVGELVAIGIEFNVANGVPTHRDLGTGWGALGDLGIHCLSQLRSVVDYAPVLDEAAVVSSLRAGHAVDDSATATLVFAGDRGPVHATIAVAWDSPRPVCRMWVRGTEAELEIELLTWEGEEEARRRPPQLHEWVDGRPRTRQLAPLITTHACHDLLAREVIEWVLHRDSARERERMQRDVLSIEILERLYGSANQLDEVNRAVNAARG